MLFQVSFDTLNGIRFQIFPVWKAISARPLCLRVRSNPGSLSPLVKPIVNARVYSASSIL